jgi:hypothetical protein
MAVDCNQQVLRFKVTIDDILLMDIVQSYQDLQEVELCLCLLHFLHFFKLVE